MLYTQCSMCRYIGFLRFPWLYQIYEYVVLCVVYSVFVCPTLDNVEFSQVLARLAYSQHFVQSLWISTQRHPVIHRHTQNVTYD